MKDQKIFIPQKFFTELDIKYDGLSEDEKAAKIGNALRDYLLERGIVVDTDLLTRSIQYTEVNSLYTGSHTVIDTDEGATVSWTESKDPAGYDFTISVPTFKVEKITAESRKRGDVESKNIEAIPCEVYSRQSVLWDFIDPFGTLIGGSAPSMPTDTPKQ